MGDDRGPRYGRRLTPAEYDRRLTELHRRLHAELQGPGEAAELERRVRSLELDLAIDRRLGVDFPREARGQLLRSRERIEARRAELAQRLLRDELTRAEFVAGMQGLVEDVVRELSAVLTRDEAQAFLGVADLGDVALALDPEQIGGRRR